MKSVPKMVYWSIVNDQVVGSYNKNKFIIDQFPEIKK